jgi:pimeloyl-ACP methyl ester carboxylesterase
MPSKQVSRRDWMKTTGAGLLAASSVPQGWAEPSGSAQRMSAGLPSDTQGRHYWTADYWANNGPARLYLYRKRLAAPVRGERPLPVIFFTHGSSLSSKPTYDLVVPGHGEYSMMNVFAAAGFDTWTMDFEGYGRSTMGPGNSDVRTGAADLAAIMPLLERETGLTRYHFYGESSGALRAAAFAAAHPERIARLVLTAYTYTGKGSPTLTKRAEQAQYYRTHRWRKRDRAMIYSIYTRDKPGTTDPAVAAAVANMELQYSDQVPTGTYLDMTVNLPLVRPEQVLAPTLLLRGQYDGIATMEDLLEFFARLPNADRQFGIIPNAAHALGTAYNRHLLWYQTLAFLREPPALPLTGDETSEQR